MPAQYGSLPFQESIDFFRGKLNLPTRAWNDIWEDMHARAFVVAGAMQQELLVDLRAAVDKAIVEGTTLQQFRKDFDSIVKKRGWSFKGDPGWRARVIYDTNVRQSYNAGRWKQIQEAKATRPYLLYRHGDSAYPRPHHLAWNGTVLPVGHPWWKTHYPQNGWGCKCKVFALSERDLRRLNLKVASAAPGGGSYDWVNKKTGEVMKIPVGIDPGFGYNVGEAAWGRTLSADAMNAWSASSDKWTRLTPGNWQTSGRPEHLPAVAAPIPLGARLYSRDEVITTLRRQLGGDEKTFAMAGLPVQVNAEVLGSHLDPNRAVFLPLLDDALTNPTEIWLAFERHSASGQVALRVRAVKLYQLADRSAVLLVFNVVKGRLEAWTFIPVSNLDYLNRQRAGSLLYAETKNPP